MQANALVGIALSMYSLYVESALRSDPFYQPSCNSFGGNCGIVFTSSWAHVLSHLELLPKGHPLDISLAAIGLILYAIYFVAITVPVHFPLREELFLFAAIIGSIFSTGLLYIIKFVLNDFCIVCTSFHGCNFVMLLLAFLEYRDPQVKHLKKKQK